MNAIYPDLKNKKILITGGGSGIGASIVEFFCEQRSNVFFIDVDKKESLKLIKKIKKKRYKLPKFIECDLLNINKLQNLIKSIISKKGPIDVLVNNAANDQRHRTEEVNEKYWENRVGVNLKHFFFASQAVINGMKKNKKGTIVNLGSVSWMLGEGDKAVSYTHLRAHET